MADAALARREARRKRILENSQNRLQLISNITSDDCCKESPVKSVRTTISEHNNEIPVTKTDGTPIRDITNNGLINNEPMSSYDVLSDDILEEFNFLGEQVLTNDSAVFGTPSPEAPESTFFEQLTSYKYDLVLLSLMIQLLYNLSIMPFDNMYFFLPLVLYSTTKSVFFVKQENSKYAHILMLLNGMTSQQTLKLMSVLHWVSIAVQDTCIYLFTTICVQSLLITFQSLIF